MKTIGSQEYIDFRIYHTVEDIKSTQCETIKILNSGMLKLFWNIGNLLNSEWNKKEVQPKAQLIREQLSNALVPTFGAYFSVENLLIMQDFAAKFCPDTIDIDAISKSISWKYIPVLNQLESPYAWQYYILVVHQQSLSPQQLEELIKQQPFKPEYMPEESLSYLISQCKSSNYRSIMDMDQFFKGDKAEDFRMLFEIKDQDFIEPDDIICGKFLEAIYLQIIDFQITYNNIAHSQINRSFLYIGYQVFNAIEALHAEITPADFINKVLQKLNSSFLDEEWLLSCLEFGKAYDPTDFVDFIYTMRFGHIKVLLTVEDKTTREYYANIAFERGLTPEQLVTFICEDKKQPLANLMMAPEPPKVKTVTSKQGNKQVVTTVRTIEQKISRETDMNCNIFTDTDAMAFLKEA